MEIKKSLFSGGEIDPALHDNIDINAWRLGLAKGLNIHAGKNGRLVNDAGTYFLKSFTSAVKVCPVEGEDYAFIFYHDGSVGRVQAVGLESYMYYGLISGDRIFHDDPSITDTGYGPIALANLKFKTVKHNDGQRWLYVVDGFGSLDTPAGTNSIKRYKLAGLNSITIETVTLTNDIPDLRAVVNTVANAADLITFGPSYSTIEDFTSFYVLSDATVADRGHWIYSPDYVPPGAIESSPGVPKVIDGVWYQLSSNSIATLSAGNYSITFAVFGALDGATVQYGVTFVTDKGEESRVVVMNTYRPNNSTNTAEYTAYTKLPVTGTSFDSITYAFNAVAHFNGHYNGKITHARVYRRPVQIGGTFGSSVVPSTWGYVGDGVLSETPIAGFFGPYITFTEYNVQADYLNQPPYISEDLTSFTSASVPSIEYPMISTGVSTYDSRLVYWLNDRIIFSRLGFPNNFLKDFPTDGNNPFVLQVGTGNTKIYGVEDNNGLIVFTDNGVYVGVNETTSQADPRIKKAGDWIIDLRVGSINTPYGVIFVDSSTNTLRRLGYSQEQKEYIGQEISSLASHLFYNKTITSMTFKPGDDSYIVVTLDDGSAINITYDQRSKVFGFFPKETLGLYQSVVPYRYSGDGLTSLIYVIERDGLKSVEIEAQRRTKNSAAYSLFQTVNFAHSTKVRPITTYSFDGELKRNNVEDWETELVIEAVDSGTELNSYFKCFNFVTGESCLMKYTSQNGDGYPIFTIVENALPESMQGKEVALFKCTLTVTGLEHLEGKDVSVMADRSLISSPYNADYPTLTVIDGQITLPNYAAFVLVGLPYISDIVTLQIDTDANNTTLLKPKIVNSVHVKFDQTRGVYVGGELPSDNSVTDMQAAEVWNIESSINTTPLPQTARKQYRLMSNWRANGSIAIRQVDPLPFEVMSVILDVSGG